MFVVDSRMTLRRNGDTMEDPAASPGRSIDEGPSIENRGRVQAREYFTMLHTEIEIKGTVREFIVTELLSGQDGAELTDDFSLIDNAILDSMAALRMFAFLEERFGVEVGPDDFSVQHMNTISNIASFIASKLKSCN